MHISLLVVQLFLVTRTVDSSEIGVTLGDAAISQMLRHAASKVLEETRVAEMLLKTKEEPAFGMLAYLKLHNTISYRNVSVQFHPNVVHVFFDRLRVRSHANLTDVLWPIAFADTCVDSNIMIPKGHLRFVVENEKVALSKCLLFQPDVALSMRDSWIINKGISALGSLVSTIFETTVCSLIDSSTSVIKHNKESKFSIYEYLPRQIQEHMAARNTTLFYKINSIEADSHQLTVRAQIEWQKLVEERSDETSRLLIGDEDGNSTETSKLLDMVMKNGDTIQIWLEDNILNEILDQIDWNFEWMDEQIPVSSPIIPPDSREFLATLCTECYFQVNVNAKGRPTIAATNESLVLTKTDRIHLQVVNPDRNVTSVFVSLVLTIEAALRPSFDNGILRTGVELMDTRIEMEKGAFPKAWGFFMGDLIRGMIMDMMWPELKNGIEELTYGKGLKLSKFCGIDPNNVNIVIGEGNFSMSTQLLLPMLEIEKCVKEVTSSLPNTSKLFQKASFRK